MGNCAWRIKPMANINNQAAVKRYALDMARSRGRRKSAVGASFLAAIEADTRAAINRRLEFHDNKCGGRKTLV